MKLFALCTSFVATVSGNHIVDLAAHAPVLPPSAPIGNLPSAPIVAPTMPIVAPTMPIVPPTSGGDPIASGGDPIVSGGDPLASGGDPIVSAPLILD